MLQSRDIIKAYLRNLLSWSLCQNPVYAIMLKSDVNLNSNGLLLKPYDKQHRSNLCQQDLIEKYTMQNALLLFPSAIALLPSSPANNKPTASSKSDTSASSGTAIKLVHSKFESTESMSVSNRTFAFKKNNLDINSLSFFVNVVPMSTFRHCVRHRPMYHVALSQNPSYTIFKTYSIRLLYRRLLLSIITRV